ncbi:WD40/YVTN repeat-like-containing domain and WD40-repeat-containing domain-containing protein [Strongyloides ratti]|uniref:WD40/YVTN repeat-like-containing domain and WD40-repeat-containing domain-containing protein n=1 Tax=Strongyloides ratti TaxID=34506 RepID=A0A090LL84_STRRB|nr:WD40/YVTN repeat-like-containing domain and WD40-repeat-containing domain-containing protein [Strongyloides ratti]CEF68290.1 WD40/YVTN repeat-like-containing domain and WD40-repeat-containing domain-containing protein [Strongyloides ratti]
MDSGSSSDTENEPNNTVNERLECGYLGHGQSRETFKVGQKVLLDISNIIFADKEANGFRDSSRINNTKKLIESKFERVFTDGTLLDFKHNRLAISSITPNKTDTIRILEVKTNERVTIGSFLAPSCDMRWAKADALLVIIDYRCNIYAFRVLENNIIDLYLRMEHGKFMNPKNMDLYTSFEDEKFICTMAYSHGSMLEIFFMDKIHFDLEVPDTNIDYVTKIDKAYLQHKMECEITAIKFDRDGNNILVGLLSGAFKVFCIVDNIELVLIETIQVCNTGGVNSFIYLDYYGPDSISLCDNVLVSSHNGTKLSIYNTTTWRNDATMRLKTTQSNYKLLISKAPDNSNFIFVTDPLSKTMLAVEISNIPTNPRFTSVTAVYLPYAILALVPISINPKDDNNCDLSYTNDDNLSDGENEEETGLTEPIICKFYALSKRLVTEIDIQFDVTVSRSCSTDSRKSSTKESYSSNIKTSLTPCTSGTGLVFSFHGEDQRIIDSLESTTLNDEKNVKECKQEEESMPPQLANIFFETENYNDTYDLLKMKNIKKSLSTTSSMLQGSEKEPSTKSSPLTESVGDQASFLDILSSINNRMEKIEDSLKNMSKTMKDIVNEAVNNLETSIISNIDESIQNNLTLLSQNVYEQSARLTVNESRKIIEDIILPTVQKCTREMENKIEKVMGEQCSRMIVNSNHTINYRNLYTEDSPPLVKDTSSLFDNFNGTGEIFDRGSTSRSIPSGGGRCSNLENEQIEETISRYLNQKAIGNVIDMIPTNTTSCAVNMLITKYKASDIYEQFKTQLNTYRIMNLICGCAQDLHTNTEDKLNYIENSLINLQDYADESNRETIISGINFILSKLPESDGLFGDLHQRYNQEILMIKHRCSEFLELYSNDD